MPGTVLFFAEGPVAFVTLSHPGKLNAMSRAMWRELRAVFERIQASSEWRCILLRGEGASFCAGGDISEYPERIAVLGPRAARLNKQALRAVASVVDATGAYRYADSLEHREGIGAFLEKRKPVF